MTVAQARERLREALDKEDRCRCLPNECKHVYKALRNARWLLKALDREDEERDAVAERIIDAFATGFSKGAPAPGPVNESVDAEREDAPFYVPVPECPTGRCGRSPCYGCACEGACLVCHEKPEMPANVKVP